MTEQCSVIFFYQTVKRLITLRMTITAYYVTQDNDLFSQLEQAMMSMWRINGKYTFCCINISNPKNSAMQFFHCVNLPKVISINSLLRLLWNAGTLCYMLKYPLHRTCMYDSDIPCLTDTILWRIFDLRYITVQYKVILHASFKLLMQVIDQSLNTERPALVCLYEYFKVNCLGYNGILHCLKTMEDRSKRLRDKCWLVCTAKLEYLLLAVRCWATGTWIWQN